jgi:hypothetical protein
MRFEANSARKLNDGEDFDDNGEVIVSQGVQRLVNEQANAFTQAMQEIQNLVRMQGKAFEGFIRSQADDVQRLVNAQAASGEDVKRLMQAHDESRRSIEELKADRDAPVDIIRDGKRKMVAVRRGSRVIPVNRNAL